MLSLQRKHQSLVAEEVVVFVSDGAEVILLER